MDAYAKFLNSAKTERELKRFKEILKQDFKDLRRVPEFSNDKELKNIINKLEELLKLRGFLSVEWKRIIRKGKITSLLRTKDGGYLAVGYEDKTFSFVEENLEAWVIKFDNKWNKVWSKNFNKKAIYSVTQATDGGYIIVGQTLPFGDGWIMKIDKNGNKKWEKILNEEIRVNSIVKTQDGGYIAVGYEVPGGCIGKDLWIAKFDRNGNQIWSKALGGGEDDSANSVIQTRDGGYIVAGYTQSKSSGKNDVWIVKFDKNGNKVWDRTFGGKKSDKANSIIQTEDGGYAVVGYTCSKKADSCNAWIIKLDKNGNRVWDRAFGDESYNEGDSVIQTEDGRYLVAGHTTALGNTWIAKIDKNGNVECKKVLIRKEDDAFNRTVSGDEAYKIIKDKNNRYIVAAIRSISPPYVSEAMVIKVDVIKP
jgi:hypothetical protein